MLGNGTLPVTVGGHYTIGRYVLRHFVKREREGKVRLSGYGVELQIKSTEYKAQDDREVKGEGGEGSEGEVEEEEVEGFVFSTLKDPLPDSLHCISGKEKSTTEVGGWGL